MAPFSFSYLTIIILNVLISSMWRFFQDAFPKTRGCCTRIKSPGTPLRFFGCFHPFPAEMPQKEFRPPPTVPSRPRLHHRLASASDFDNSPFILVAMTRWVAQGAFRGEIASPPFKRLCVYHIYYSTWIGECHYIYHT